MFEMIINLFNPVKVTFGMVRREVTCANYALLIQSNAGLRRYHRVRRCLFFVNPQDITRAASSSGRAADF
jgi:hypothetical protein